MSPQQYKRRIFLAVTGLSPQVVTESLYAMAVDYRDENSRFLPTEIHLVTTARGSEHARLNLLSDRPGRYHQLCRDYPGKGLESIDFSEQHIHVIRDLNGNALDDIRDSHENDVAADYISALVRKFTSDPDSSLHISIAGGRKTMGYYLGYALSLYGREQDRLSHVLVSEPYEKNRDFYYPTPHESVIHIKESGVDVAYDCRRAIIDLAGIPFVRLRQGLPEDLLAGNASFTQIVAEAQKSLPQESLGISLKDQSITFSGTPVKLPPALLTFYALLALRKKQARKGIHWTQEDLTEDYLHLYGQVVNSFSGNYAKTEANLNKGISQEFVEVKKSKINRHLIKALGKRMAQPYLIYQQQKMPGTGFNLIGIDVAAENILIV